MFEPSGKVDDVTNLIALNDGRQIPQLGIGVWQLTDGIEPALEAAIETGYRHIDTAAMYKNEAAVGRIVAGSGIAREQFWVTTKLWNDRHTDAAAALRESLDKLQMDYVDLFLIHWPSPRNGTYVKAWESLVELRSQGLTRSIGVSNFTVAHLDALARQSDVVPSVNQVELHPTFPQTELRRVHAERGIVTEAWSPLGQSKELTHPVVREIAADLGVTSAQVILAWHLAHGIVVFPKSSDPSRIKENWAAQKVRLPDNVIATLDGLDEGNRIGPDPENADF